MMCSQGHLSLAECLQQICIIVNQTDTVTVLSACSVRSGGTLTVRFCFCHLFIVLVRQQSSAAECHCSGSPLIYTSREAFSPLFRQQRKVSELPNAIAPQSHFRRDCLELDTDRKKASLCPQRDLLSSPLWPRSLSFSTPTHTHTQLLARSTV